MAYTALEEMQELNIRKYGRKTGPYQPRYYNRGNGNDLKTAALRFLHDTCEGLRFGKRSVAEEFASGEFTGKSVKSGQIPYNMQMDIDRYCLERTLGHFIDSGAADDAYEVYYCYLEMFMGAYGKSKSMVELLSEFEVNGSSLLIKHRDHYSHSVYVFALGLAIYETNSVFRRDFMEFYGLKDKKKAAHRFLEFWGLTSLFHDIGYPFELPFEQAMSYFEISKRERVPGIPYLSYNSLDGLEKLSEKEQRHFKKIYGKTFLTVNELLAHCIAGKLGDDYGFSEGYLLQKISSKPVHPEDFGYFMDHAFFSALRLYREYLKTVGIAKISKEHIDALAAIILHNSLYKFCIEFYKSKNKKASLRPDTFPLAYLLMLCDELQCWDRTAYGRNSRRELHPMAADFDFSDDRIKVKYYFDIEEKPKIDDYEAKRKAFLNKETKEKPRLKAYSDMAHDNAFAEDIGSIVDLNGIGLTVTVGTMHADRSKKHTYLSNSSFIHLYDFAVALNGRYSHGDDSETVSAGQLEAEFDDMSLEYKISNINQAKNFGKYLNDIGCFYSDKPVDFDILKVIDQKQLDVIAPLEHERWLMEHRECGWRFGDDYLALPKDEQKQYREQTRCHHLMLDGDFSHDDALRHFAALPPEEQNKDAKPMNCMLRLIKKFDGLRIYRL